MSTNTPTNLESRITRLETSATRWRLATCSLLFLALAAFSLGAITLGGGTGGINAPLITADNLTIKQSITLPDSNGNPRILLSIRNDAPLIQLLDPNGQPRLTLSTNEKSILIQSPEGKKIFTAP